MEDDGKYNATLTVPFYCVLNVINHKLRGHYGKPVTPKRFYRMKIIMNRILEMYSVKNEPIINPDIFDFPSYTDLKELWTSIMDKKSD